VDVDIVLRRDSYNDVLSLINKGYFALYELSLIRIDKWLFTFAYKDDYIDLYFFEKRGNHYWLGQSYSIESYQIDDTPSEIDFLGEQFITVSNIEKYLVRHYGADWRVPIKNKPSTI
jgi:hypothetical protein